MAKAVLMKVMELVLVLELGLGILLLPLVVKSREVERTW